MLCTKRRVSCTVNHAAVWSNMTWASSQCQALFSDTQWNPSERRVVNVLLTRMLPPVESVLMAYSSRDERNLCLWGT